MPDTPDPAALTAQRSATHRPDSSDGMPHQVGSHVICTRADGFIMFDDYTIREERVRDVDALLDYAAERLTEAPDGRYWINVLNDPALSGVRELVVSQAGFPDDDAGSYIAWSTDPVVDPMTRPVRRLRAVFAALDGESYDDLDAAALVDLAATRLHHSDDDQQRRATFWREAARILGMERAAQRGVRDRVLAILREHEIPVPRGEVAPERAALRSERDFAVDPYAVEEAIADRVIVEVARLRADQAHQAEALIEHMTWAVRTLGVTVESEVDAAAHHVAQAVNDAAEDITEAVEHAVPRRRGEVVRGVRLRRWGMRRDQRDAARSARQEATQGQDEASGGR